MTAAVTRRRMLGGLAAAGISGSLALRGEAAPAPPTSQAAEAGEAAAGSPITIAFIGDSMIDGLWGGVERLVTREPCLSSRVKLLRFGENGSGLTRPARFDWIARAKAVTAQWKPTLSLVSLGLNDRQSIVDGEGRFDLGTPGWRKHYGDLVARLARASAQTTAGALWIGLPALRDAVSQSDAAEKDAIFSEAIGALADPRIAYVQPWRQGGAEPDAFQAYGPDLGGARVQIRTSDGIHFTAAGYDVLTRYVFDKAVAHLRAQNVPLVYPCAT